MGSRDCQIIHYRYRCHLEPGEAISLEELARLARVHPEMIVRLVDWGLVEPLVCQPEPLFSETVVPRIWKILRLHRDLGANWAGIGVILDLLDRIEELEREIAWLRKQL